MQNWQELVKLEILPKVKKPARYTDHEAGSVHKPWDKTSVHLALCFPDLYEIGMSNLGIQLLYHIVNQRPEYLCERVFSPDLDLEGLLRAKNVPLFSLESYQALNAFDLVGISLQHELTYTNFVTMLELGRIPLLAKDRAGEDPYVFIGGHCAYNPAPVSEFIDFAIIGEGEEVLLEVMDFYQRNRTLPRDRFLSTLADQVEGVYVPALDNPVRKRMIKDLSTIPLPTRPIVPFIETVHDRLTVEIMRGCARACRFCQAGYVMLPKRELATSKILDHIEQTLANTGYDEISLTSLSSGDHSRIEPLLKELLDRYRDKKINISLPSLRIDSLSEEMIAATQTVRHSSLTLAPEAGTQRLRDLLNKQITEAELLQSIEKALAHKTNSLKLYFMVGLPTETREDLAGIVDLTEKIKPILKSHPRARCTINISNFIPKPHTPLQWSRQCSPEELREKQDFLRQNILGKQFQVKGHDPELSFLEGVFSRGDRRLGKVLRTAVEKGARFDSWTEHFAPRLWQEAFSACGIDPADYLRERELAERSPWENIHTGVPLENLKAEYRKALGPIKARVAVQ